MAETVLERTARAVCMVRCPAAEPGHACGATGEKCTRARDRLPEVRAVLEAVREPSVEMLDASDAMFPENKRIWQAMIDAILKETDRG